MKFANEAPATSDELNSGELSSRNRMVGSGVDERDGSRYDIVQHFSNGEDEENQELFTGKIPEGLSDKTSEVKSPSSWKRLVNFLHKFGSRHAQTAEAEEKVHISTQAEEKVQQVTEDVEEEKVHELVAVEEPKITHSSTPLGAGEGIRKQAVKQIVWENDVPESKPLEVLKSENDFDKKKPKNKKDKPDPENTDVKEDPEDAQKQESEKTREEKELALARKLDKGAEAVSKAFGALKNKLGVIVPEKVKDFIEARDVQKKVEKSEVFANREKAINEVVSLTHQITEKTSKIVSIDSHIARENSALNDAKNELVLRKQLAGDDSDLIAAAEETFKEHEATIAEKIADLREQKVPLVAEKENLLKQKEASQALVRGDNERLRVLVDGRVENLKARVGHEQILANQENLSLELSTEKEKLRKLDAKISAYRATIERGGYSKEKVNSFKESLKTMEGQAKLVRKAVSEYQKKFDQIRTVTETLDRRFKAMREVLRGMGVVDEKVKKPEEVKVTGQKTQTPDATQAKVTTPPTATTSPQPQGPEQGIDDPNDLPQDVYEKMFGGQPSVDEENFDRQREQLAQISKGRFDDLLKNVGKNQNRPKPDDVSNLIKFARDFIKEKILSPKLIETEVEELKNPQLKRDEKISLLKRIQSKLNSPKK